MTKYLSREVINRHLETLGQEKREGRADKGLEMQGSSEVNHNDVTVKVARVSHYRPELYEGVGGQDEVDIKLGPQSTATRRDESELVTSQHDVLRPRGEVLGGRRVAWPHPNVESGEKFARKTSNTKRLVK